MKKKICVGKNVYRNNENEYVEIQDENEDKSDFIIESLRTEIVDLQVKSNLIGLETSMGALNIPKIRIG